MNIPRIIFVNNSLSKEADWLHGFLFNNNWGWGRYIFKKHPKLKNIFNIKGETRQVEYLKKYVTKYRRDNRVKIESNVALYKKNWDKVEKKFFIILSEILQISWPKNKKSIKAMVSINPICPRFLKIWSFTIFCNYKKPVYAIETIMHECCHFLYFEKWKKMYPQISTKKFEEPYIEWHLSEIVAPIILNDKRVQKILKQKAVFYAEHNKLKLGKENVPRYFTNLYNKNKTDFESFIIKAYKIIKAKEKLFK
jgi:hypothetical protein